MSGHTPGPPKRGGQQTMTAAQYRQQFCTEKQASPLHQLRGTQNREAGELFEEYLTAGCEHYRLQGVADIEKTPEPMEPIKRLEQGRFIAVFKKKAQCDYKGTLAGGRSIVFEAKHTDSDRIQRRAVSGDQEQWLQNHCSLGARCYVMVSLRARAFFRVPWPFWRDMKRHLGRKYATEQELQPFRVPLAPCTGQSGGYRMGVLFLEETEKNTE